jgi:histidinol dehydrogenase
MKLFEYPSADARARVRNIIDRGLGFSKADYDNVQAFIDDVKTRGDEALVAYTNQFDSGAVTQDTLKVTDAEFEHALASVDPLFLDSLKRAIDQLTRFHEKQKQNAWIDTPRNGVIVGQLVRPVGAAGIYVPGAKGGKTPLVSSVLMGGIPAKVAGVSTIALMTPPMENGEVNPHILAAAAKMGITSVFKAGSAWAIAALAYGTRHCRP